MDTTEQEMIELDTKEAGKYAVGAFFDARRRNSNNKSHYSNDQIRRALIVRDLLDTAFSYRDLYINYRKKFIAVKAEAARVRDSFKSREILALFKEQGYNVVATPQGIIVRLDR
jgi:hypothetical protein